MFNTEELDERENIIVWEKWVDPYLQTIQDSVPTGDEEDEDLEEEYLEDEEDIEEYGSVDKLGKFRAIATPMGIIPINESTASGKIFNFWVGHTNFDITNALALIIEETAGVETLDIFTRYRFRIGIGKAFHDSKVMRDINSRVYDYLI
tara:strand:- start:12185 stop:12631 length:447 start_codon:yes stop_codon:yes gene_type:complete